MNILVTGAAGFIGYHLCKKLIKNGISVVGVDDFNSYYDPNLKYNRKENLLSVAQKLNVKFEIIDSKIEDESSMRYIFSKIKPEIVVNLAAQAGVRYSLTNPNAYIKSNLVGFGVILECCREQKVEHLVYASSSSVYGGNTLMPFSEEHNVDHPVSLYAATKKSNELMAHCYSHLYNLPTTGLRFFTVYGPWGRPDMALFIFTKSILNGVPIKIFNHGEMLRDFTYIDDIVESLMRIINKAPTKNDQFNKKNPSCSTSWAPYKIFNIGNSNPTKLMDYIKAIEKHLGKEAIKEFLPLQPGDVPATSSDTSLLEKWINFKPQTSVDVGVGKFIDWYKNFYKI
tara:strand:+ start:274 stop:1296 length:1023 start_codon:yes stop_codon:yes gene_type:complete